jgi:hypothetical protein
VKKSRIVWPVAVAVLLLSLGLLSGLAAGADGGTGDPSTTTGTSVPATSTDPGTSTTTVPVTSTTTDPGTSTTTVPVTSTTTDPVTSTTTTDPVTSTTTTVPVTSTTTTDPVTSTTVPATTTTTTDPATTTQPVTTTDPATTSTTGPVVTAENIASPMSDSTTQSTPTVTTTVPQATTTIAAPPTAPCDTTQITCGNNASTQVAIVSQICTASSENTTLNVQIQTLGGTPVNNVAISPQTSCLNTLQITQIVEQYCVGCTVIVIPPPAPVIYVAVPGTNTITNSVTYSVTTVETPAPPAPVRVQAYCTPKPILLPDGKMGNLIYLPVGEPQRNPTYGGAVPAAFFPGIGMKCPNAMTVSAHVPVFTLTVPASFVGQYVKLCLQPASTKAKPLCHSIRIDLGATIAVPVTSNVVASVVKGKTKTVKGSKSKGKKKTVSQAASAFSSALTSPAKKTTSGKYTSRKG